jgi:sugar lactone lactonase YvrE
MRFCTNKNLYIILGILICSGSGCKKSNSGTDNNNLIYVSTLAGTGVAGYSNGPGNTAATRGVTGLAVDQRGNVFCADLGNQLIRKINSNGIVSDYAGNLSGTVGINESIFESPAGVALDATGQVFVADAGRSNILKISASGTVSAISATDNLGKPFYFSRAWAIAVDPSGNLYVTDRSNYLIRKITPAGLVSTLAGNSTQGSADGIGTAASFSNPFALAIGPSGNLYVVDADSRLIREIDANGVVTTFAGAGKLVTFAEPGGIAVDQFENVYVADTYKLVIYKITQQGVATIYAGNGAYGAADGAAAQASFQGPSALAIDLSGNLYVSDNFRIRKIGVKQ